ncbi:hypothetical protein GOP47_0029840 [Adiantum capillus-veneris]|nr:hypothetical protein GOP47_0029840 [Adiantum capillus-veneris]
MSTSSPSQSDRWENVAAMVPGKDADAVRRHYELLVEDIKNIDLGKVKLPSYPQMAAAAQSAMEPVAGFGESSYTKSGAVSGRPSGVSGGNSGSGKVGTFKSAEQERRKGTPWTEEEHRLFLLGLEKYGKGDWRSISRNFVISRTPTQVASHAQKYFIRLNSINKERRRSSIHDITSVNNTGTTVFGAPVCPPMVGPGGSTIGTPVPLQPSPIAGPYVTRAPLPGPGLPSPAVSGVPMVYAVPQQPVSQPATHR